VKAIKEFSHPQLETMVAIDLNRAIATTMLVAQNELKYVADTTTDFDADLPLVSCLPGDINQVVLNLLVNAAHAIGEAVGTSGARGRITVSTRGDRGHVEIRVADTGTGIPEHVQPRVFEPFFTTKPVGRGTGQGLALAHATIVKKHGGQIVFETEPGRGTTFIVRLPLVSATDGGPRRC
jgi:two-component system, NtrC family, sensor kinase